MRWVGHLARMGEMRYAYKMLVGKPKGERSLEERWHRLKVNNGRYGYRWEIVDLMHLASNRDRWQALMNMLMNIQFP